MAGFHVFIQFEDATKDAAAHFARRVAQVDVQVVQARLDERVRPAAHTALVRAIRPFDDFAGQRFASFEHQRHEWLRGSRQRARPAESCNHFKYFNFSATHFLL